MAVDLVYPIYAHSCDLARSNQLSSKKLKFFDDMEIFTFSVIASMDAAP
jgi:hypothetical protein